MIWAPTTEPAEVPDDPVGVGELQALLGQSLEDAELPGDAGDPTAAEDECRTCHGATLGGRGKRRAPV